MSWQTYVDDNLVGTGKVSKASIIGQDGSLWATTAGFQVGGEEAKKVVAAFKNATEIQEKGLYIEGKKYVFLQSDDHTVLARAGATGIVCVSAKQCVLIGFYDESIQAGDCNTVMQNLADYLINQGY
ncbi:profilin, required for normal timing of actin polymerization in response to thermal stress, partial [Podila humilis]